MHILLTDVLSCPRCGPDLGLIILADRMDDRRIIEGSVGCANCRESYPVTGGLGDLRYPPGQGIPPAQSYPSHDEEERAFRLAALMGVTEGPGHVLVIGPGAVLAPRIAGSIPEIEVIAADPTVAVQQEAPGVSRIIHGDRIPLRSGGIRGVVITGEPHPNLLREAVRTLDRSARIVVEESDDSTATILTSSGLQILLQQDGVAVASYSGRG